MYKIVKEPRAWWPVEFKGVSEDGTVVTNQVELKFILHDEDDHLAILAEAAALPGKARKLVASIMAVTFEGVDPALAAEALAMAEATDEPAPAGPAGPAEQTRIAVIYATFLQKLAVDWRGVGAENGDPLKWTPEEIAQLCAVPNFFKAAVAAWRDCRAGEKDTRAGN